MVVIQSDQSSCDYGPHFFNSDLNFSLAILYGMIFLRAPYSLLFRDLDVLSKGKVRLSDVG